MKYLSVQTFQCGISVSGAATFTGGATINLLALNGATTSSEASLFLGAHGTNEGGQLVLQKGTSNTYAAHLDNYNDQFRILYGTNTGSTGVALAVSLSNRQLILPAYTSPSSFSGTAAGYLAFDSSGNIITTSVPTSGVSSIIAGTGVTVSSSTGNVTVSIGQSVATSATPSFDQIFLTNNGNGTNVKIGDDAWIGDVNAANTLRIMGQQNNADGYIIFGNSNTTALGRSGTGNLTYGGSTVWTAATLTDLNQLTNGPGYITSAALAGYVPTSRTLTINGTSYDLSADRTWTINTVAYTSRLQHQVKAGVAINKGQAVYVTSADGTNMIVGLASNASEATSSKTMGLLDATVSTNGFANVVTEGLLAGLDTSSAGSEGDPVWLGTGGNLIYGLANKPYAPAHLVFIGIVTRKNQNNGEIFVKVQNGFELNEIHDVDLKTTVPVNGHILGFDGTLWVNKTIAGWLGYTPANASGTTNYLSKFTGANTLGDSKIVDNGSSIQFLVNSLNSGSKFYMSPVHADGRINFNVVAGSSDYTILRAWHSGGTIGLGTGSSTGGGALSVYGDSVLIGTSGAIYFMNGTFGPLNVPYRLGITTSATTTYFGTGVINNLTNIESNAFQYTAKSHTFYTGTTTGNQYEPNQYTPLFLSTAGNVVVGSTTDSGYKLEVKNTSGSSALRISNNNDGSGMRFGISNGTNSQYLDLNYWVTLQAFAGYSMNLSVGSAYGVYLDSSNNVGIGTNAPAYKLHVAGTTLVQNTSNATLYINETGGNVGDVANLYLIGNNMGWGASLRYNVGAGGANNRLDFYTGTFRRMSIAADTGNLLINTITDSGYKLDVNGTARINSSLYITDSAYTGAGRLFQSANSTFVVTGGPGGGSENITFGPSNRIFINAPQTRVSSLFQIAGGLSVGTWTYPGTYGAQAYIGGSTTANGGGGRGLYIDSTVVAAANNDVLVGLDVNPTFTNGAFTGVSNYGIRLQNSTLALFDAPIYSQAGSNAFNTNFSVTGTAGSDYTIYSSRNFIFNTGQSMYFNTDTDGGGATERNWYFAGARTGTTGGRTYAAITVNGSGFPSLTIYNNDNGERIQLNSNAASYFNGGNLLVGTTTDSGYKLDVNGTGIFRDNLKLVTGVLSFDGVTSYWGNAIKYESSQIRIYQSGDIHATFGGGTITLKGNTNITTSGGTNVLLAYSSYVQAWQTFYVSQSGGTHNFVVSNASSGGNAYFNNVNVGIGTSSPAEKLHIFGNLRVQTSAAANTASTATIELNPETTTPAYIQAVSNFGPTSSTVYSAGLKFIVSNRDASLPSPYYSIDALSILANGNIGVGTNSPTQLLHVAGNLRLTGAFYDSNNSAGTAGQILKSTATGTDWVSLSEITGVDGTGTANYVTKWSDADTIANSLIYDNGTNVGISTTSPGYNFDVNGQVRVQDKLRVGTVNSGNGVVHMSSSATINPSATTIVWAQNVSVGMCAFIEYYILNSNSLTDQRAGTIMVTWNQSGTPTIAHTETTTPDIGSTIAVNFTSSLVGSDARINAVNSSANPYTIVMSYKYF